MKAIDAIKQIYHNGQFLPVYETYYTIQGEGFHVGKPVFFIRLAGCTIGCPWCDTKGSWKPNPNQLINVTELAKQASSFPAKSMLLTGGEPLLYDLNPLSNEMKKLNITTYLETTGTEPLTGQWDWICVSPKPYKKSLPQVVKMANELKIIIYSDSDFDLALDYAKIVSPNTLLFLQPEWSRRKQVIPKIVEFVKNNPHWRISLQAHKYMGIP